ncbi:hypothetical protein TrVGV298_006261 [Trichoderma virens]|nr:hypothetical protein TrVGV298_006261 [Trichoderma virens]
MPFKKDLKTLHLQQTIKKPVASFFFSSDFESRDDPYEAIRWWISEVITRNQPAFDHVRIKREKQDEPAATRTFILQLFSDIVNIVPGCVFVIDGLDECTWLNKGNNPGRRDSIASFLENLDRAIANSATRVLIVSRDESEIRSGVEDMKSTIFEYNILPEDVDRDTRQFARSIVNKKLSKKSEALKLDISEKMAIKCGGQFLWLKLQEDSLRSWKNQKQLQDAIDKTPSGLDNLYYRNWVRLSRLPKDERNRAFSLLRWVTFAIRPLTVAEIAEAVLISFENEELPIDELPDFIDDDYVNSEILGIGGSLLSIRKSSVALDPGVDTIRLTHFSVKQYFLSHDPNTGDTLQANEKLRSSNERTENITLAQLCLRYIHYEEIWQFEHDEDSGQVQGSFRDYAAGYWHRHAHNGSPEDELVSDLITSLFDTNGTVWEAWKEWFDCREKMKVEAYLETSMPNNPIYYTSKLDLTLITLRLIDEYRHQLDDRSYFGETAIAAACENGNEVISQALIDAGANIKLASYDGETPLHIAANEGHLNLVMLLLENGADYNAINKSSATALHYAAYVGRADIAKILLQYGADYLVQNFHGLIPLHHAAGPYFGSVDIVRALLLHGADINFTSKDGYDALLSATEGGRTEVIKVLLEHGANVSTSQLKKTGTPLGMAIREGHYEVVELLLNNGASYNAVLETEWLPLTLASFEGQVNIAKLLLSLGAGIDESTAVGPTPLLAAISNEKWQ